MASSAGPENTAASTAPPASPTTLGDRIIGVWLDNGVLACGCPQCRAPLAVQPERWIADCWTCGISLALPARLQTQGQRLLSTLAIGEPVATAARGADVGQAPPPLPTWATLTSRAAPTLVAGPPPRADSVAAANGELMVLECEGARRLFDLKLLVASLASLLLHLIVMIVLGLWLIQLDERPANMVLTMSVANEHLDGQAGTLEQRSPDTPLQVNELIDLKPTAAVAQQSAETDLARATPVVTAPARELLEPIAASGPVLPTSLGGTGAIYAGRDPRTRSKVALAEGGTTQTEAAVEAGLRWLSAHQRDDGGWSLEGFSRCGDCNGQCDGAGRTVSDTGATALALLPFLGSGQTHHRGDYPLVVAKGLKWLIEHQGIGGDLRGRGSGRMYAHGQAAIVLCEAYALSQHTMLKEPAQRAIDFIVQAQHPRGGWRYAPGEPGDLSVVGWQYMALRSAQMAGLDVPGDVLKKAGQFLDSVQTVDKKAKDKAALFSYLPGNGPTPTMTAEGLLCRQYSGWTYKEPLLIGGANFLLQRHPPGGRSHDIYYIYYATQVMHHLGGEPWKQWNPLMQAHLLGSQESEGHATGSWPPQGGHDSQGGRLYTTSLAICTLEVYYRHLPLYRVSGARSGMPPLQPQ